MAARGLLWLALLSCVAEKTYAQDSEQGDQRQAAAAAYDRGTAAYLADDYTRAARWFETAHRLAPAAPALIQAVRAHNKADDMPRALTLALQLEREYPDDERATSLAAELLGSHSLAFTRIEVVCDGCKVDLDGKLQDSTTLFLEPETQHEISGVFSTGRVTKQVSGGAAETLTLTFGAPPAPPPGEEAENKVVGLPVSEVPATNWKWSPVPFYVAAGVTAVLVAVTVISGVDANNMAEPYDQVIDESRVAGCSTSMPRDTSLCGDLKAEATRLLQPADSAETRTNVLLGVTLFAAVNTALLAFVFTDWSSVEDTREKADLRWGVASRGDGVFAAIEGKF